MKKNNLLFYVLFCSYPRPKNLLINTLSTFLLFQHLVTVRRVSGLLAVDGIYIIQLTLSACMSVMHAYTRGQIGLKKGVEVYYDTGKIMGMSITGWEGHRSYMSYFSWRSDRADHWRGGVL